MEIAGTVALVTGAGTGIGQASAAAFARRGAAVLCTDIDGGRAEETAQGIRNEGGRAASCAADVSSPDGIRSMFAAAVTHFGGVDIVHNNAGLIGGEPLWPDSPLEKIAAVIAVNLGGVAMGTQEGILALRRRGGGVIVNTASVAALRPMPTDPVYSATKVGVIRIVESCAGLVDEGIRVCAVLPGVVDTEMTRLHTGDGTRPATWLASVLAATTMLTADDIAAAVIDLVTDDSATGDRAVRIVMNPQ